MSIGLKRGTVEVVTYDPNWVIEFNTEKKKLLKVFGDKIVAIEHIGSTSIPDMPAKPIIDINMAIQSLDDAKDFVKPLEKLGYQYMANRWFEDRYFFPKGPESFRTHHLNLVEKTSETAWLYPILFRNYLIKHHEAKQQYIKLKKGLAGKYKNDREKYTEAKSEFVSEILAKAKLELKS